MSVQTMKFTDSALIALTVEDGLDNQQKRDAVTAIRSPRFESQPGKNIGDGVVIGKFEVVGSDD